MLNGTQVALKVLCALKSQPFSRKISKTADFLLLEMQIRGAFLPQKKCTKTIRVLFDV